MNVEISVDDLNALLMYLEDYAILIDNPDELADLTERLSKSLFPEEETDDYSQEH